MKKKYSTPQIMFDTFELSENIAVGCAVISNHNEGICPVPVFGTVLFMQEPCIMTPLNDDQLKMYTSKVCYHNPSENDKIFTS